MKFIFLAISIACWQVNFAQSKQDSLDVVQAVQQLFTAMHTGDSVMLVQCFSHNAFVQTISTQIPGKPQVKTEDINRFGSFVKNAEAGSIREEIIIQHVHIDGVLASVWAPYKFFYKGEFSHCGVNSFQLVKGENGWRIQYLTDTRVKENCDKR